MSLDFSPLSEGLGAASEMLTILVVCYPFVTSLLWSLSSIAYLARHRVDAPATPVVMLPRYSIVIPFHAEPQAALASARSVASVDPPYDEIVLVDDGSPCSLSASAVLPPRTRLLRLDVRSGKASALQAAVAEIDSEIVVCMDADTETESTDWSGMLSQFRDPALGGVTGKIRAIRPHRILDGLQQLDYLTVICLIKAAESRWGGLLTLSGAFSAFRRSALTQVGGWSRSSSAEDIDLSWRLQCNGWRLAYVSRWTCRVEMAPTLRALWRQRRRWSAGLGRALRDYGVEATCGGARHIPVVVTVSASLLWAFATLFVALTSVLQATAGAEVSAADWLNPRIGIIVAISYALFVAQFVCALLIDRRPFRAWFGLALLAPFYPFYFWLVLFPSFVAGFPRGFLRRDSGMWQRTVRNSEVSVSP